MDKSITFHEVYNMIEKSINRWVVFGIYNDYVQTYFDIKISSCSLKQDIGTDYENIYEIGIETEAVFPIRLIDKNSTLDYVYNEFENLIECRNSNSNKLYYSIEFC